MTPRNLVLWLFCASLGTMAQAQWQWQDKDGRTVFSDRPPPADVAAKNLHHKEQVPDKAPVPTGTDTADGVVPARMASAPSSRNDLATLRQRASDAEHARKKTEQQAQAAASEANCNRARQMLATLNSGERLNRRNTNGELEYLDEAQVAAEKRHTQEVIQSDCN